MEKKEDSLFMFDLDSSLPSLQGMCCSENNKLEKRKSFEGMSSGASVQKTMPQILLASQILFFMM